MSGYFSDFKTLHTFHSVIQMIAVSITLAACSSHQDKTAAPSEKAPSKSFTSVIADTVTGSVSSAFKAVQAPLEDIGLKRDSIPEKLQVISSNPYALPAPPDCGAITGEISSLDVLLGPDVFNTGADGNSLASSWNSVNNISLKNKEQYTQQGAAWIQQEATDTARNRITGFIPYRNWIRWISGADAHAKKVAQAYEVGKLRRAFLKGFATNLHCMVAVNEQPAEVNKLTDAQETALNDDKP